MSLSPEIPQRLIDVEELADLLKLSVRTVYRLIDEGKIPEPMHIGRNVRWQLSEVIPCLSRLDETEPSLPSAGGSTAPSPTAPVVDLQSEESSASTSPSDPRNPGPAAPGSTTDTSSSEGELA